MFGEAPSLLLMRRVCAEMKTKRTMNATIDFSGRKDFSSIVQTFIFLTFIVMGAGCFTSSSKPVPKPDKVPVYEFALCGPASSGKTTLFRQIQRIRNKNLSIQPHHDHYDDDLIALWRECTRTLLYLSSLKGNQDDILILKELMSLIDNPLISHHSNQISKAIHDIWSKYGGFKHTLAHCNLYQEEFVLNPNVSYFMDRMHGITTNSDDFSIKHLLDEIPIRLPMDDVVESPYAEREFEYLSTAGEQAKIFRVKDYSATTISSCSSSSIVVFVVALSDYCETLPSNPSMNKMQYAISRYKSLMNYLMFQCRSCKLIVVLNKLDLFKERIRKGISLRVCFGYEWTVNDKSTKLNEDIRSIIRWWVISLEIPIGKVIPNDIADIIFRYTWDDWDASTWYRHRYIASEEHIIEEAIAFIKRKFTGSAYQSATATVVDLDSAKSIWKYCESLAM